MTKLTQAQADVRKLGACEVPSPLKLSMVVGDGVANFVADDARMPLHIEVHTDAPAPEPVLFEKAGPRRMLHFDPAETKAAIVTCGGLCPGLNNVIRSALLQFHYGYGVENVLGIRYGYVGLDPDRGTEPIALDPDFVDNIHTSGGTVLGTSRGPVEPSVAVEFLRNRDVNILLCVGGDGTQRGAHAIAAEAHRQAYPLAVVGVPKTIDNDIPYVHQTFGFFTAVETARKVIECAHIEARSAKNGISVVKLMGRDAGFIVAAATVASQDVNFAMVPEVPFALVGQTGLLNLLQQRMQHKDHAVVVVAEGAGQDLMPQGKARYDASGNLQHQDIGGFLKSKIEKHFQTCKMDVKVKYIDPSYVIRSVPADAEDAVLCDQLARHAVDAGMSGRTDTLVGQWYGVYIHVPISLVTAEKKCLCPESELWRSVLAATGQPAYIGQA